MVIRLFLFKLTFFCEKWYNHLNFGEICYMIKTTSRFNLWFFIIAIIQFAITLYTDKYIFSITNFSTNPLYITAKIVVLGILISFWQHIHTTINRVKENNSETKTFLKYFFIYFSIMIVFLVITWPGVWRNDEFFILHKVIFLHLDSWHHWITSFYYLICLCIFPNPSGIVIIQVALISAIISNIITKLNKLYPDQPNWLIMIPLIFPSIIINNLYPIRLTLYSYVEIYLFSTIVFKYLDKSNINYKDILIWGLLTSLVAIWRSESIFYLIAIPMVFFIFLKDRLSLRKIITLLLITILASSSILRFQRDCGNGKNYTLMSIIAPLRAIVQTDFKSNNKKNDLEVIGKIYNLNYLVKGTNEEYFWESVKKNSLDEDLPELQKVYAKLIIYNFSTFTKERMEKFIESKSNIEVPKSCIDSEKQTGSLMVLKTHFPQKHYEKFRFLEFKKSNGEFYNEFLYNLFYSPFISFILLIMIFLIEFLSQKREIKIISTFSFLILFQTLLTIVGSPFPHFMYYLPCYIFAGICTTILLIFFVKNHILTYFKK